MRVQIPLGARVIVEDIEPLDEVSARLQIAGLVGAIKDENKPKSTMGKVIAIGNDPLIQESVRTGDVVYFNWHAGTGLQLNGRAHRILDFAEILSIERDESGLTES